MSSSTTNVSEIGARAASEIAGASSLDALEALRVKYLGRNGEITLLTKQIGAQPADQRKAFGASVNFWTLLALNIGISTLASLVPVPGGATAVSAVGLSGVLVTFGVPEATAAAGVLAHQLAVSYLPAIPGLFATRDLIRKGLL